MSNTDAERARRMRDVADRLLVAAEESMSPDLVVKMRRVASELLSAASEVETAELAKSPG